MASWRIPCSKNGLTSTIRRGVFSTRGGMGMKTRETLKHALGGHAKARPKDHGASRPKQHDQSTSQQVSGTCMEHVPNDQVVKGVMEPGGQGDYGTRWQQKKEAVRWLVALQVLGQMKKCCIGGQRSGGQAELRHSMRASNMEARGGARRCLGAFFSGNTVAPWHGPRYKHSGAFAWALAQTRSRLGTGKAIPLAGASSKNGLTSTIRRGVFSLRSGMGMKARETLEHALGGHAKARSKDHSASHPKPVHQFMNAFVNHRDSDHLIVSPCNYFSLSLGCALRKWIWSEFNDRPLAPFTGILSLGIGDTMGVIGYSHSQQGRKTGLGLEQRRDSRVALTNETEESNVWALLISIPA
ncbi:hypothetical protein Syun_017664 [Stephania yunnanensis]|uniref:dolichol kinase n=1 Tax=Stephania yunnanensis TaxID=152371 RepID=A0AAP0J9P9_9MAGN